MPCIMAIGQQQTTSLVGLPDKFFAHRRSKLQGRVGPRRQPTSAPAAGNSAPRPLPVVCFLAGSPLCCFGGILARLALI